MKTIYKNLIIKSEFKGNKKMANFGNEHQSENWNNHIISIRNAETKKATCFEFWGSFNNPKIETERELLWAVECLMTDASCGNYSFKEFCNELGYNYTAKKSYTVYKLCVRIKEKFEKICDEDIYDFVNELREYLEG